MSQLAIDFSRAQLVRMIACLQVRQVVEMLNGLGHTISLRRMRVIEAPTWRQRAIRHADTILQKDFGHLESVESTQATQQRLVLKRAICALDAVLAIQGEINAAALLQGRPTIDLLNDEEEARIRELIAVGTWPRGWTGGEPTGDELLPAYSDSGLGLSIQNLLPGFGEVA